MKFSFFLILVISLFSCKHQDQIYPFEQENVPKEGLSFKEDSIISSISTTNLTASEIILENGETMTEFANRLGVPIKASVSPIGNPSPNANFSAFPVYGPGNDREVFNFKLLQRGLAICDAKFVKEKELDTTIYVTTPQKTIEKKRYVRPRQTELGYVYYGEPRIDIRKPAGQCLLMLYGTDCSGMATLMFNNAGVTFDTKYRAHDLSNEGIINEAIRSSPTLKDFDYEYEIQPKTHLSKVVSGDIIYFRLGNGDIRHMGIILKGKNGILNVFQSNGSDSPSSPTNKGCDIYEQKDRRGPHQVDIPQMLRSGFGDYGFLHLVPRKKVPDNLVGTWKVTGVQTYIYIKNKKNYISLQVMDVTNPHISFDAKNNYIAYGDDTGKYFGTFVTFNKGDSWIRLSEDIFKIKRPHSAEILELSEKKLKLSFYTEEYKSYSEFTFEKQ